MLTNQKFLLQFNDLTLDFDGRTILNRINGSISEGERIGLVGNNGAGKSTLLQILSSRLQPTGGSVQTERVVRYVPQMELRLLRLDIPVFKYIENKYDSWWDVLLKYEEIFGGSLNEGQSLSSLSGGELSKLHIAIAFVGDPDLLLLDEPTNHLDLSSIDKLGRALNDARMAYAIAGHNIDFLDTLTDKTWVIENSELSIYGGNYSFYKKVRQKDVEGRLRRLEVVNKKLKQQKRSLHKATVRFQKEKAKWEKLGKSNDRSLPKIVRNSIRLDMQTKFGSLKTAKMKSIDNTAAELQQLRSHKRKLPHIILQGTDKKGLLISIKQGQLILPTGRSLLDSFDFKLHHGDRVAILGDNGTGKTTFIKQLAYKSADLIDGAVRYGTPYKTFYIDQKYDCVNPDLSVIDNILGANPRIVEAGARKLAGVMGFHDIDDVTKPSGVLSGGETVRLVFAMVLSSDTDLLILDEPTNNLDIETLDVIIEAVNNFRGALTVISHDTHFLQAVGIERAYQVYGRRDSGPTMGPTLREEKPWQHP